MHARYAKNRIDSVRSQRSNNGLAACEMWHVKDSFSSFSAMYPTGSVAQGLLYLPYYLCLTAIMD